MATELTWTDTDKLAVDTARVLAADAVEKTGNGHPGTAISLAPLGYLLSTRLWPSTRPTRTGSAVTASSCPQDTPR